MYAKSLTQKNTQNHSIISISFSFLFPFISFSDFSPFSDHNFQSYLFIYCSSSFLCLSLNASLILSQAIQVFYSANIHLQYTMTKCKCLKIHFAVQILFGIIMKWLKAEGWWSSISFDIAWPSQKIWNKWFVRHSKWTKAMPFGPEKILCSLSKFQSNKIGKYEFCASFDPKNDHDDMNRTGHDFLSSDWHGQMIESNLKRKSFNSMQTITWNSVLKILNFGQWKMKTLQRVIIWYAAYYAYCTIFHK